MKRNRTTLQLLRIWAYIAMRYYHPDTEFGKVISKARLVTQKELTKREDDAKKA